MPISKNAHFSTSQWSPRVVFPQIWLPACNLQPFPSVTPGPTVQNALMTTPSPRTASGCTTAVACKNLKPGSTLVNAVPTGESACSCVDRDESCSICCSRSLFSGKSESTATALALILPGQSPYLLKEMLLQCDVGKTCIPRVDMVCKDSGDLPIGR